MESDFLMFATGTGDVDMDITDVTLDAGDVFRTMADMGMDVTHTECIEMIVEADVENNGFITLPELKNTLATGKFEAVKMYSCCQLIFITNQLLSLGVKFLSLHKCPGCSITG